MVGSSGGLEVDADAENFEVDGCDKELGRGSDKKKPTAFMLIISGVITTQMILLTRINCTFGHFIHFIKGKKGNIQNIFSPVANLSVTWDKCPISAIDTGTVTRDG